MAEITTIPLNKLDRNPKNVRKTYSVGRKHARRDKLPSLPTSVNIRNHPSSRGRPAIKIPLVED